MIWWRFLFFIQTFETLNIKKAIRCTTESTSYTILLVDQTVQDTGSADASFIISASKRLIFEYRYIKEDFTASRRDLRVPKYYLKYKDQD